MEQLITTFEAWRTIRLDSREVIDAVVAPAHRGPSATLRAGLAAWPGAHYWLDPDRTHLVLIRAAGPARRERWVLHAVLLAVTIICSLGAGAMLAGAWQPPPVRWQLGSWNGLGPMLAPLSGAAHFFADVSGGEWRAILSGWSFALPLLAILLVHELGHYFAARRYGIDTSPPYFLPIPPTLSPIGSLGAFIRLRSPVVDRRQLLDVGAAGPLAGFAVSLAVLCWGYAVSESAAAVPDLSGSFIVFAGQPVALGESLLTGVMRDYFLPDAPAVHLSLPAFAGWVGVFITGLNLLPLSQLDGGHVLYGLIGRRQALVGMFTVIGLVVLAQFNWSWYVWVALVLVIGGGRWSHPSVVSPVRPVPIGRRWMGWLCVLVFFLTFVPVPFRL